jgi:hypothetical protein
VRSFIYKKCEIHKKISSKIELPSTTCDKLYDQYAEYCYNQKEEILDMKAFGTEMAALHIDRKRKGSRGSLQWYYVGVTLKENEDGKQ